MPDKLQWATEPIRDLEKCRLMYLLNYNITSSQICAGNINKQHKGTCQGDSGGPLACLRNGVVELVGITSFGYGCADPRGFPDVFARVSEYLDWINFNMVIVDDWQMANLLSDLFIF